MQDMKIMCGIIIKTLRADYKLILIFYYTTFISTLEMVEMKRDVKNSLSYYFFFLSQVTKKVSYYNMRSFLETSTQHRHF